MSNDPPPARARREPPRFRRVSVQRVEALGPRMTRITLGGPDLDGFPLPDVAASVRLLLPPTGAHELVAVQWNGNEFLLPDGRRPTIRTLTPLRVDTTTNELDVEIVGHDGGAASEFARAAQPGDEVALSGPGRGYAIDASAPRYVVGGDETALPAMGQLLAALPAKIPVVVHVEIAYADARRDTAVPARVDAAWHLLGGGDRPGDALAAAMRTAGITADDRVWAAGEAAGVQRIRRYLFEELGLGRTRTSVRGYWKHGRAGDTDRED